MDKPLIVSYRWSTQEIFLLHRLYRKHSAEGFKFRRTALGGGIIALVLVVSLPLRQHRDAFVFFLTSVVVLASGLTFAMPFFMRRWVLKKYAQQPDRDLVITYELSEERLVYRSEVASSELLWRVIRKVLRTPEGFILYTTETSIHWLPVRGFQNKADIEEFTQFAKSNLQGFEQASNSKPGAGKAPLLSKSFKRYLIIWLSFVTFLLLLTSQAHMPAYLRLMRRGMPLNGTVSQIFPQDPVTIRYKYEVGGRLFRRQGPVGPPNASAAQLSVGDAIVVYYDPLDPLNSLPGESGTTLRHEIVNVATLSFLLPTFLMGVYLLAFRHSRPGRMR